MHASKSLVMALCLGIYLACGATSCLDTSDDIQRRQQEVMLKEATAETGMPAIANFQERKMMKMIIELRDQVNLATYTYLANEMQGKVGDLLCDSIGFGLPYATQYTSPMKYERQGITLPQADPNGLFSPASAEGTWILCKNPNGKDVGPVYAEPKLVVSPFPLK